MPNNELLERVKRAYRLATADFSISRLSLWRGIYARQKPIHDALLSDDNSRLADIFANPVATDLYYGVDNLCAGVPTSQHGNGSAELAELIDVAEAAGVKDTDPELILQNLDALIGRIEFPNPFAGEVGLPTTRGIASTRAIHAIYHLYRISQTAKTGNARILEIGPGMGRTAYYCYRSGLTDYTTIDLPMGVVAQACFLSATIGPDKIWMLGDADSLSDGRIKLLPQASAKDLRGTYDIIFNSDSLVEMSPLQIAAYLWFIRRRAKTFLSINHEKTRLKIKDFASVVLAGRDKTRSPYPLRDGYFEEVFY